MFGLTALFLAALGIYGVISYLVSERSHEIGIRRALGAQNRNILELVLRQGIGLAFAGAAFGLLCALGVSRLMSSVLFGVKAYDPVVFLSVPFLLLVVALIASYLPARRATKIDPITALRDG
jgi:putative ABC transport system permease protein